MNTFRERPSDQFLCLVGSLYRTGHPYLGNQRDVKPHTGGHLYSKHQIKRGIRRAQNNTRRSSQLPMGSSRVSTKRFVLRPVYFPSLGTTRANVRYGIDITFAQAGGQPVSFHYSIEPMVEPGDLDSLSTLLDGVPEQRVRKGEIIARMVLTADTRRLRELAYHFQSKFASINSSPLRFSMLE